MSTGRVAVTVQRRWLFLSEPASQERSSTYGLDARPVRRCRRVQSAPWFAAGLLAFPSARAGGQTAAGVPAVSKGIASVLAGHLRELAALNKTLIHRSPPG
jgi:hypothetical protein